MGDRKGTKVYVGNLNPDANERDMRDMFERYGHLTDVWVARKPPGKRYGGHVHDCMYAMIFCYFLQIAIDSTGPNLLAVLTATWR